MKSKIKVRVIPLDKSNQGKIFLLLFEVFTK